MMAKVHIKEIMKYLDSKGESDALPENSKEGFFVEINFDEPDNKSKVVVDEEYQDRVITVECPYGSVTILFDELGQLKSLDIS